MKLVTVSDTRYASCFSSWSFFLSSSSSTLSLFLPLSDVYVFVSSIIFHFSRSCPSLAASFATLSSLHATLPSLLTDYRDSSLFLPLHCTLFRGVTLAFFKPFSFSVLFYSSFFIYLFSTVVFHLQRPLCSILLSPFAQSLTTHCLLSFFPCRNLSCLLLATSFSPFLTLPLTLFLPRSHTLFLFLSPSFLTLLHRSILVTLFSLSLIFLFFFPPPISLLSLLFIQTILLHRHLLSLRLFSFHYLPLPLFSSIFLLPLTRSPLFLSFFICLSLFLAVDYTRSGFRPGPSSILFHARAFP